jgi:hypothetical protein
MKLSVLKTYKHVEVILGRDTLHKRRNSYNFFSLENAKDFPNLEMEILNNGAVSVKTDDFHRLIPLANVEYAEPVEGSKIAQAAAPKSKTTSKSA